MSSFFVVIVLVKAEGNGRYRLVWAKLCHWSNRASIVRELEGLEDKISVNLVGHAPHEKNLGWEYVYNENNTFFADFAVPSVDVQGNNQRSRGA